MDKHNNCADCEHMKVDELWGEYKCLALGSKIYILLESFECPYYDRKKLTKKDKK